MAAGAVPSVLGSGHGLAPFLVSMIMLAVGAGMFGHYKNEYNELKECRLVQK